MSSSIAKNTFIFKFQKSFTFETEATAVALNAVFSQFKIGKKFTSFGLKVAL